MKFYLKHILTREITTNTRNCLVIILRIGTFPEAILIFIKEKKEKISKDLFLIYTLPTFTTYKQLKSICILRETFLLTS